MVRSRDPGTIGRTAVLTLDSIQEALRTFFLPIKNDDPQLDFYTMYKRETMEYDTEYMKKYNEDLNTTLIFVCIRAPSSSYSVDHILRPVFSRQSAPPSLSTSSPSSSQTQMNDPKLTSEPFSSLSTDPLFQAKPLPFLRRGMVPPRRLSQPWTCCMQAF